MRLVLVVNASASAVTVRARVVIAKALAADHDVAVVETSRRGHATRLAREAADDRVDAVVVLGGDGTLNEAANGLAGSRTALASLPGGSTNVFARTIGFPNDPIEATGALLDALAARSVRRIGLGSVNDRFFLFHTGAGFDAAVVEQVERRAPLKRYASHPLFVYAAFDTALRRYDRTRPKLAVVHADGTVVDDVYLAVCFNSDPYSFLGSLPLHFAPTASLDRPLTVVAVRTLAVPTVLRLVSDALRGGTHIARHPLVDVRHDLDSVRFDGFGPVPFQVDGDHLGDAEQLRFRHVPDCLDVVVPRQPLSLRPPRRRPDEPRRARWL